MIETLHEYRQLQDSLSWIRYEAQGSESDQETTILDQMDVLWSRLSDDERLEISNEPSRGDVVESSLYCDEMVDVDVINNPTRPPRRMKTKDDQ